MKTLISAANLRAAIAAGAPAVLLDCSFDLADPAAGERAWREGHLPGSQYVHLDHDLAGAKHDAAGRFLGRHPLPERAAFAQRLGQLGITPATAVVCFDAQGAPYASRAWWLLRWMGHADVAVLDGGTAAWREAGGALVSDSPAPSAAPPYPALPPALPTIEADALRARLGRTPLIDARAAKALAGARNRFFKDNLAPDGRFKGAEALRAEWLPLLAGHAAPEVVQQCGSGVTACHNLLALAHAGLGDSVLYPGSWSEWSADAGRPQAKG
jgi:thiosulfate/3-mercaptopyruvate sulfurtransferase